MQRLLSSDLWPELKKAAKNSRRRRGAIAYASKDILGFRRGDTLVVDASESAIRSAATSARLLSRLERKGVALYHHPGLHAKVMLFDNAAFVGSSNLSVSSHSALEEAGILTDSKATLSQVESFLERLVARSQPLHRGAIRLLCRIKVKRASGPWFGKARKRFPTVALGEGTWVVGVTEMDREWTEAERKELADAEKTITRKYGVRKNALSWIRWGGLGPFVRDGRPGDRLIQISRSHRNARPSFVYCATPVLDFAKIGRSTFVAVREPEGKKSRIRWGAFQKLMDRLGNRRRLGPNSERLLELDLADAIDRTWGRP